MDTNSIVLAKWNAGGSCQGGWLAEGLTVYIQITESVGVWAQCLRHKYLPKDIVKM